MYFKYVIFWIDMNKISESDMAEFHGKGFLLVKNCFSELEINQAIKKTQEFGLLPQHMTYQKRYLERFGIIWWLIKGCKPGELLLKNNL